MSKMMLEKLHLTGNKGAALGVFLAGLVSALVTPVSDAEARDLTLGGHRADQQHSNIKNEIKAKLPENALALPRLVASVLNKETGRWQRVLVEAYLQSTDHKVMGQVREHLKDIAERARPQLQSRAAETLEAAREGPSEAKNCIRLAMKESLGYSWSGDIFIRSLAVF
jgi:hypothetical protein